MENLKSYDYKHQWVFKSRIVENSFSYPQARPLSSPADLVCGLE